jgi:hypothetical protein
MSLIFATQLTAVATLALAVLALATAVLALLAWRKQSREVRDQTEMLRVQAEQLAEDRKVNVEQIRVLGLQAEELRQVAADREHEVAGKRRAQAILVVMWASPVVADLGGPYAAQVYLRNTSEQPVYGVRFGWDWDGRFTPTALRVEPLMPGETSGASLELPPGLPAGQVSVAIIFRDRAGTWWCTWVNGRLEEIPEPAPLFPSSQVAEGTSAPEIAP